MPIFRLFFTRPNLRAMRRRRRRRRRQSLYHFITLSASASHRHPFASRSRIRTHFAAPTSSVASSFFFGGIASASIDRSARGARRRVRETNPRDRPTD
jgi:hypothetical protein